MKTPRGVVFDFDGVILDSTPIKRQAFAEIFSDFPEKISAIVDLHERHGGINRYKKFEWIYRDILKKPLSEETSAALGEAFQHVVISQILSCPFVPGAKSALSTLSKHMPLFVCSGTPEEELRSIVEKRNLQPYFKGVFGSPAEKDEILRRIAQALSGDTKDLLFVGDALTDLNAAKAVGCAFVGVSTSNTTAPFPRSSTFPVISDLRELTSLLEKSTT